MLFLVAILTSSSVSWSEGAGTSDPTVPMLTRFLATATGQGRDAYSLAWRDEGTPGVLHQAGFPVTLLGPGHVVAKECDYRYKESQTFLRRPKVLAILFEIMFLSEFLLPNASFRQSSWFLTKISHTSRKFCRLLQPLL